MMKRLTVTFLSVAFLLGSGIVRAENFPQRAITIVVPFAAGGVTDEVTRLLAAKVAEDIAQPVVVENKPGGGGQIAANSVKQAAPDGYTLLVGDIGTHAINASLYSKLSYDPVKDFAPVTELVEMPHLLVVPPESPYKAMADLIAGARAQPGGLTYASVGVGSGSHLLGEMLKADEKIDIVHAPYRGSSQIVPDLMAGRVAMFFGAVGSMAPLIAQGKIRALVVTDSQRSPLLLNVPSAPEAGTPDLILKVWFGIFAPAATNPEVVTALNAAFVKALSRPDVQERLKDWGTKAIGNTPQDFAAVIKADSLRLGKVVKASGATLE